jgi:hypothetical protein
MTTTATTLKTRLINALVIFIACMAAVGAGIATLVLAYPPPVELTSLSVTPTAVCAGQTFAVDADLQLVRSPLVVTLVQSWWSKDTQTTVFVNTDTLNAVYTSKGPTKVIAVVPVPQLPLGEYEYRLAARVVGNSAASVVVEPVTIKACQ